MDTIENLFTLKFRDRSICYGGIYCSKFVLYSANPVLTEFFVKISWTWFNLYMEVANMFF